MNGHARPRLAPPPPLRSSARELKQLAANLGIDLYPWQTQAARYFTARDGDHLRYREVCVIVARQNGKTTLLVPLVISRLLAGRRIMHTAQNRTLPREVFMEVAELLMRQYRGLVKGEPRFANGQEQIHLLNGGIYRIVAPTRGGARGPSNDDVIIDELREMDTDDFIAAAKPTLIASPDPQMIYLSNAGTNTSVVLNALRSRSQTDANLAYLEWSAAPERDPDDRAGWRESNPAIGHRPGLLANLLAEYRANQLGGTMPIFETEHLCRWAASLRQRAISAKVWAALRTPEPLEGVPGPYALGIGVAPGWERATIVVAALRSDGRIGAEVYRDLRSDVTPVSVTAAIEDFHAERQTLAIAYDAMSGGAGEFARHAALSSLPYDGLKPGAMVAATMDAMELMMAGRLAVDDPLLDFQVPAVVRRSIGQDGVFRFSRGQSTGSIDAIEAMVLAVHAIARVGIKPNIW